MPSLTHSELIKLKRRMICCDCIGERYLQRHIRDSGRSRLCFYCKEVRQCISMDDFSDKVQFGFKNFYEKTDREPDLYESIRQADDEDSYIFERDGYPVVDIIEDRAVVSRDIAEALRSILYERFLGEAHDECDNVELEFDENSQYVEIELGHSGGLMDLWINFENELRHKSRFFSASALGFLERMFKDIRKFRCSDGTKAVREIGPGTDIEYLIRGRVYHTPEELATDLKNPHLTLGPPPPKKAGENRMNARGIPIFYGALQEKTVIAEIKPPVGAYVLTARFQITRSASVLDLTAMTNLKVRGSIFDPSYKDRLERSIFFKKLCRMLTKPVMPGDESLNYVTTQAISDYLSSYIDPKVDGIIYPSRQAGANLLNVALFNHASGVEDLKYLPNAVVSSFYERDDDDTSPDFRVTESIPRDEYLEYKKIKKDDESSNRKAPRGPPAVVEPMHLNRRKSSNVFLRIMKESLKVHEVKSVRVDCDEQSVDWSVIPRLYTESRT